MGTKTFVAAFITICFVLISSANATLITQPGHHEFEYTATFTPADPGAGTEAEYVYADIVIGALLGLEFINIRCVIEGGGGIVWDLIHLDPGSVIDLDQFGRDEGYAMYYPIYLFDTTHQDAFDTYQEFLDQANVTGIAFRYYTNTHPAEIHPWQSTITLSFIAKPVPSPSGILLLLAGVAAIYRTSQKSNKSLV